MAKAKVSDDNKAMYKLQPVFSMRQVGNTTRLAEFYHQAEIDFLLEEGYVPVGNPVPHAYERYTLVQAFFKAS